MKRLVLLACALLLTACVESREVKSVTYPASTLLRADNGEICRLRDSISVVPGDKVSCHWHPPIQVHTR